MIGSLKKHWNVNTRQVILILCTFAVTGTITAWLSKKVAEWLLLHPYGWAWWLSKIVVLIFGYQVIILIVGFCFGMFPFFWKYEKKILRRMGLMEKDVSTVPHHEDTSSDSPVRIAIFASGAGSNAQKIIDHFKEKTWARVALIICNNPGAGVLQIASKENIPVLMLEKKIFAETGYTEEIKKYKIDFLVLAGFLWKVPETLIRNFQRKIINIHPALLPDFGGKGMYGHAVHAAVIAAGKKESGITIHYVDEQYDHGTIIFQARCPVDDNETAESLAQKIHALEHTFYPQQIESLLIQLKQ
jgi:formyltetrahydrofolate-dependent phosphoribosylglycinamide formyltransferase